MQLIDLGYHPSPDSIIETLSDNQLVSFLFLVEMPGDVEKSLKLKGFIGRQEGEVFAVILPEENFKLGIQQGESPREFLTQIAAQHHIYFMEFTSGSRLGRINIPKPWGKEIWYTGVEKRGVCQFEGPTGSSPLPYFISVFPKTLLGAKKELVLLKILDPHPEPVFGDLYLEVHEKKSEVYVITSVDEKAWTDGKGKIRMGIHPQKWSQYCEKDLGGLKKDFLDTIRQYEKVRRSIDRALDAQRATEGFPANSQVPVARSKAWLANIEPSELQREKTLRTKMNSFTQLLPLNVGDVVKVPLLVPHALQHGVRAVEFQTPVYERLVVSFAQKVLTQEHWNTEEAFAKMNWHPAAIPSPKILSENVDYQREEIVEFDDFKSERLTVKTSFSHQGFKNYGLLFSLCNGLRIEIGKKIIVLDKEEAILLPCNQPWKSNFGMFLTVYP